MSESSGLIYWITGLVSGIVEIIMSVQAALATFMQVNHKVVSVLMQFGADFLSTFWAVLSLIFIGICSIVAGVVDFVCELGNVIAAFLYLIWKVLILFLSLLDLLFHFLECIVQFLWTGGKWTATTIKISGQNLSENGLSTWKYFVMSIREFTNSVVGGFTTIGEFAKAFAIFLYNAVGYCSENAYEILLYVDNIVRYSCRYCFDSSYFFVTEYLLNMPKEAYFGIIISCCLCVILKNIIHQMCSQGLTFPMTGWLTSRSFIEEYDSDFEEVDGDRGEFSDDEDALHYTRVRFDDLDDNLDEYSVNSDVSDESSEDDEDDENDSDEELELVDESDNESNAASESELSDINIDLPSANNGLRRSVTPSRLTKGMSTDDMQKYLESEKEKRMCVVCQDRSKSVLILPCRHMCLCVDCGNQIARARRERRKCPLCRGKINTVMNVYV